MGIKHTLFLTNPLILIHMIHAKGREVLIESHRVPDPNSCFKRATAYHSVFIVIIAFYFPAISWKKFLAVYASCRGKTSDLSSCSSCWSPFDWPEIRLRKPLTRAPFPNVVWWVQVVLICRAAVSWLCWASALQWKEHEVRGMQPHSQEPERQSVQKAERSEGTSGKKTQKRFWSSRWSWPLSPLLHLVQGRWKYGGCECDHPSLFVSCSLVMDLAIATSYTKGVYFANSLNVSGRQLL